MAIHGHGGLLSDKMLFALLLVISVAGSDYMHGDERAPAKGDQQESGSLFCATSADCSLAGECVAKSSCACDPGWSGGRCERLALGTSSAAIKTDEWTWGGSAVRDRQTRRWHLFYSAMVLKCGLLHYQTNSIVRHAIGTSANGPWTDVGVALAPRPAHWDSGNVHAPTVRFDAMSGEWLLFYESTGWKRGPIDCPDNRSRPAVYVSRTRRIGVAAARSLDGPWRRLDAPILAPRAPPAWDSSDVSNAAPHMLANGSVLLAYRAGGDGVALGGGIGVAVAPLWNGTYERRGRSTASSLFAAEDAVIFPSVDASGRARRGGLHMLVHRFAPIPPNGSKVAAGVGGHAWSTDDGLTWTYDEATPAYDNALTWRANGTRARLYRRERPQIALDASGHLVALLNGAWPCHVGRETEDDKDAARGCASYTLTTAVEPRGR